MTLPTIIPNEHPVWRYRLVNRFVRDMFWICPEFNFDWAGYEKNTFIINSGYAFDGVSSPIFRKKLESIPSILAAALLHDVILQAKHECPEAGITWKDTVNVWKAALRSFNAPFSRVLGFAVGFWFNPIFNLFRK